jgi:hypothetical protein
MQVKYTRIVLGFSSMLDKLEINRPDTLGLVTMSFFWKYMLHDRSARFGVSDAVELKD